MKLKKGKLWRTLWRQKSVSEENNFYYDDSVDGSSQRSSHSRSESRSSSDISITSFTPDSSRTPSVSASISVGDSFDNNSDVFTPNTPLNSTMSASTNNNDSYNSSPPNEGHRKPRPHSYAGHSVEAESSSKNRSKVRSIPEDREYLSRSMEAVDTSSKTKKHGDAKVSHSISNLMKSLSPNENKKHKHHHHQDDSFQETASQTSLDRNSFDETRTSSRNSEYEDGRRPRASSESKPNKSASNGSKPKRNSADTHNDHDNQSSPSNGHKHSHHKHKHKHNSHSDNGHHSHKTERPKTLDLNINVQNDNGKDVQKGDSDEWVEEEDIGVVTCSGHEHKQDVIYMDEVVHLSVDQVFELLFSDSDFYRKFLEVRKTYDLVPSPWPEEPDENGDKKREIRYTLSLNYSIGPKFSISTEKQRILPQSKPGQLYVIETDCTQSGIPYGDNFYVWNRYCITRVASNKTRVLVQSEVRYKKTVWGLVKNFVDKNAVQGLINNFKLMGEMLRAEAEKTSPQAASGRKKMLRKRRQHGIAPDRSPSMKRAAEQRGHAPPVQSPAAKGSHIEDDWHIKLTADSLVRLVCAILIVLVFFNAVLFYKLWNLENKALSLHHHHSYAHRYQDPLHSAQSSHHHTSEEWNHIIDQQHRLHELELDRWKEVLTASVQLVDQMKLTLQELLANIEHRTRLLGEMVQQQKQSTKQH